MRKLVVPLSAVMLVALVAWPAAAAGGDPFTKSWSRTDVDGSRETLQFGGSSDAKTWAYVDERATSCAGGTFESSGTGTVTGNVADLEGTGGCVGGPAGPAGGTFTYDPGSGTIDDGTGLLWHRGNGAREAFLGVWKATDLDGSAMRLTFRSVDQLTRDVSFIDDLATSCDPDAVWMGEGTGIIGSTPGQGRLITVSLEGACLGGDVVAFDQKYEYVVSTDTIHGPLDLDGSELPFTVDWHRG